MIDQAIAELALVVGTTAACAAVGRGSATHYRRHPKSPPRPRPAPKPPRPQPRALSEAERQGVREVLRSERFVDMAPPEGHAPGRGRVPGLGAHHGPDPGFGRRGAGAAAAGCPPGVPEAGADGRVAEPGLELGHHLPVRRARHLQPLRGGLDAGHARERQPGRAPARRQHPQAGRRARPAHHPRRPRLLDELQAGRPAALRSGRDQEPLPGPTARTTTSTRRPGSRPSGTGPSSPTFGSAQDARAFSKRFFGWYNDDHRHSGIGYHTPADVHHGRAGKVREARAVVLSAAHAAHPERFVLRPPPPPQLPRPAWINQPTPDEAAQP